MSQKSNRYIPLETLFSNTSTIIQRATRECDGEKVILKSLVALYPTQAQLQRFLFSCEVTKKFNHPNILKVLDFQERNNTPFMVFEDHQSIDLRKYTQQQVDKCIPIVDFFVIAIQIAEALSVIHHAQVIHKDLHPGNLLICPQTLKVQVTDFGLASILNREQPSLASPEKLEGLLPYISPEQTGRMNRALDYRTDFYTLGITFYELLSGQLPFSANDALGMVHAHIAKAHKPINQLDKTIPVMVSKLIDKLLSKSAEERYQSALGLKHDLEKCLQGYQQGIKTETFELGEADVSDRFQLSQKLYGRTEEVNVLLSHFNQVIKGQPQLLCVSGYSGVGKSVLINEVHKPIAAHNGLFLAGKFDQFQRSTPYFAFKQALTTWLLKTLSLPERQLTAYRENLTNALGANARVLIDIMIEFKPLLGDLPDVPILGADEAQNRLNFILLKLIRFIAEDTPLVICIDDLQWADRSSLNLLPLLMREADCALLVIVAYRDNEVDDAHPVMKTLNAVRDHKSESISELSLAPLCTGDVQQLIIDSLHCSAQRAQPLVEMVYQKTDGNPFFINEFLKTLYSEKLLNFDLTRLCWQWNTDAIVTKGITDNVVELMLRKMQKLPLRTQKMLQIASCIGTRFDVALLSVVAEQTENYITRILWPAIEEGLVFQAHILAEATSNNALKHIDHSAVAQFKFLHDRMLQAAYQSMSAAEQQQTHLTIGRLLRNRYINEQASSNAHYATSLFSIVEQLNHGRSLITDGAEQLFLAELNQQASTMAKSSSAWEAVVQYARVGMSLLPANSWQSCYQLTFSLLQLKAEGEYLCGYPEASDKLYSELLNYCHEDIFKAQIYATRALEHSGRGLWYKGIEFALQGLASLGMPLIGWANEVATEKENINKGHIVNAELLMKEQTLFDEQIKQTPIESIEQLPEMTDSRKLIAIKILSTLTACAFLLNNTVLMRLGVLRGLNLVLTAGKSDLAGSQLTWFAVLLVQQHDYARGAEVAEHAIKLLKYYPHAQELASSYNVLAGLVLPIKQTYSECSQQHKMAYEIGLENGEIARGVISLNNTLFLNYSSGIALSSIKSQALDISRVCRRKKVFAPQGTNILTLTKALMVPSEHAAKSLEAIHSPELLSKIKGSLHEYALFHYRSELAFWYGDSQKSLELAGEAHNGFKIGARFSLYMDHLLQYALLLLADRGRVLGETRHNNVLVPNDDLRYCLEELKILAESCPTNFDHKYQLLLAEQGQIEKLPLVVVATRYKRAIESAKENGFIQYQALANELFALYLNRIGLVEAATAYLEEAVYLYQRWGCTARILYLKKNYAQLLPFIKNVEGVPDYSNSALNSEAYSSSILSSGTSRNGEFGDESGLDFESVMKSSQLISSELKLNSLAQKIMGVLTESAGAQTAALILNTPKGPRVQARVSDQDDSKIELSQAENNAPEMLDQCLDLPRSIISYALRTDKVVNISDVATNTSFENEPYLKSQSPQSILCVPVDYRDKKVGVLYLENKLTSKAFTESRLAVINMLLSQTAISIENARLFEETNQLTQGLELKVTERTEALSESNNALQIANDELNAFSYSVSHDLRSPLRTMKGFSQILLSEYSDTLDRMGVRLLQRIKDGSSRMGDLINGLLELSRVQSDDMVLGRLNLSSIAQEIVNDLNESNADRCVEFICEPNIQVQGDDIMLSSVMVNLLNNAWKYSAKKEQAKVEFGHKKLKGKKVYFVKDNGAGFDMEKADMLFGAFQRMHTEKEFSGTGIGLATVKRIINRHKGEIWAEAEKGMGATFYFTL
ncbi:MAG: putative ATPase/signal transduction histidine kinase [Oleiphilaceae bacterium]